MRENIPLTSIRGVAAIWVIFYHFGELHDTPPFLPNLGRHGWTAVDLFFVLSGFILMQVHPTFERARILPFLFKRAARVLPLHWAVMIALAVIAAAATAAHIPFNADGHYNWSTFPAAFLLVKWAVPGHGTWNGASWSLAVEMICYIAMPFFSPAITNAGSRSLTLAACVLTALMCAYNALLLWTWAGHPADAWITAPGVGRGVLAFPLGCVLARLAILQRDRIEPWAATMEAVGLAFMVAASAIDAPYLIPAGAALLILGLSFESGPVARALYAKPLHWLGKVSFSIYLLHQTILLFLGKVMTPAHMPVPIALVAPVRAAVAIALVLVASAATYRWIELPGQTIPRRIGVRVRARVADQVRLTAS